MILSKSHDEALLMISNLTAIITSHCPPYLPALTNAVQAVKQAGRLEQLETDLQRIKSLEEDLRMAISVKSGSFEDGWTCLLTGHQMDSILSTLQQTNKPEQKCICDWSVGIGPDVKCPIHGSLSPNNEPTDQLTAIKERYEYNLHSTDPQRAFISWNYYTDIRDLLAIIEQVRTDNKRISDLLADYMNEVSSS